MKAFLRGTLWRTACLTEDKSPTAATSCNTETWYIHYETGYKIQVCFSVCNHSRSSINCHRDNLPPLHMELPFLGTHSISPQESLDQFSTFQKMQIPLSHFISASVCSKKKPTDSGAFLPFDNSTKEGYFFPPCPSLYIVPNCPKQETCKVGCCSPETCFVSLCWHVDKTSSLPWPVYWHWLCVRDLVEAQVFEIHTTGKI